MSQQITTLSFFKYQGFRQKLWAFGMMQFAHRHLAAVAGMSFYKLMGSGKGFGFNPLPDWSTYCLLQVWDSETKAHAFFESAELVQQYKEQATAIKVYFLKNLMAKGAWSGGNPFEQSQSLDPNIENIAVITRATIRWSQLRKFWSYVPTSQKRLAQAPGLIYTKGVGEVPIVQMATFSIWENKEALMNFAYRGEEHQKAIALTRSTGWYKEELFARFQMYREENILGN